MKIANRNSLCSKSYAVLLHAVHVVLCGASGLTLCCCAVLCQVLRACITLCGVAPTVLHWAGFAMLRCYAELSNCAVFPVVLRCANFTETDKSIKPLKAAYLIRGADPLSKTLNNFLVTLTVKSKIASLCSTDLPTESGKSGREGIQ